MRRAAVCGAATVLGWVLALWAVYQKPRLDWPDFALIVAVGLLAYGGAWIKETIYEIIKEEGITDEK